MKHVHLLKCRLLSKEPKHLNNRDQVCRSCELSIISHVICCIGRGRGGKVQGGELQCILVFL